MKDDLNFIQFEDIVALDIISNFAKSFFNITGLILDIDDPQGFHPKKFYSNLDENKFCRIIKNTNTGLNKCLKAGKENGAKAAELNKPIIYTCHAGLTDVSVPIIINNRHIATLCTGQVLTAKPLLSTFDEISKSLDYTNTDMDKLKRSYFNTPVISLQVLKDYIILIKIIINYIVEIEDKILFLKNNISEKFFIEKAKSYIENNYTKKIYIEDVAKHVCISKYYFARLFKKETGQTFIEYLNHTRILKAKKRLINNSITSVCYDVGFSSLPHFYKIFERFVNCTPGEYISSINKFKIS
jgi:AraC-like DNA-binding protein/ligand-binding sensor protein